MSYLNKLAWSKLPPAFVHAMLDGHSLLGLIFAAPVFIVCLSGSVAMFAHEFGRWEQPMAPIVDSASPQAIDCAIREALARNPKTEALRISLPQPDMPHLTIGGGEVGAHWLANHDGHLFGEVVTPWTNFMVALHASLNLSRLGVLLVSVIGVALMTLLISGLLSHPRLFKDAFHIRWGGSELQQEVDLHARIGVWALPFHTMISLTGALVGLSTITVGLVGYMTVNGDVKKLTALAAPWYPADDPRSAPLPAVEPMFRTIQREASGAVPNSIFFQHPGQTGQSVFIIVTHRTRLAQGSVFAFDGSGKLLSGREGIPAADVLLAFRALHYGWFGGGILKVVYALLGVGLTFVTSTGITTWFARRRIKGRSAPGWERLWTAYVWSQPLALAVSALVAVTAVTPSPGRVWAVTTFVACAAAALWTPERLSLGLRALTSAMLIFLTAAHGWLHRGHAGDPIAAVVNAALITVAMLLIGTLYFEVRHARNIERLERAELTPESLPIEVSEGVSDERPPVNSQNTNQPSRFGAGGPQSQGVRFDQ